MHGKIGKIGAFVILGIFMTLIMAPTVSADATDWSNTGDSFGAHKYLGSTDDYDVIVISGSGGTNQRMRITSGGNIGIGTDTTPDATLEIIDSGTTPFMISNGVDGDGDYMLMDTNGRLGIGVTDPNFKLEVTGSSGSGYFGVTTSSYLDFLLSGIQVSFF